jgi:hypothetical protein
VPAISAAVALSVSGACAVRGAGAPGAARCAPTGAAPRAVGQLPDDGPQGGEQPPSRWGGQSHHHRAQPRETPRHQGPQPRKRLRPACTSGYAPSCTCTSPPWLPESFGGVHGVGPTPAYGGLASQVPAPPATKVRQDGQPHRVLADLLHLHPRDWEVTVARHSAEWFNNSRLQGDYNPTSAPWATCQPILRA